MRQNKTEMEYERNTGYELCCINIMYVPPKQCLQPIYPPFLNKNRLYYKWLHRHITDLITCK